MDVEKFAKDMKMETSEKREETLRCLYKELSAKVNVVDSLRKLRKQSGACIPTRDIDSGSC